MTMLNSVKIVFICLFLMSCATSSAKTQKNNIILYGGVGYTKEAAQPMLYQLLTDGTYRLEDTVEQLVIKLNQNSGGVKQLSPYPVALLVDDAEATIARELGKDQAPFDSVSHLPKYFDRVLGIYLIGSYEQHMDFAYPYRMSDGTERTSYHDHFFTSVTALLMDLENDEVVLSASALGQVSSKSADQKMDRKKDQQHQFLKAYSQASDKALERLIALIQKKDLNKIGDKDRHIVTGVWVNGDKASSLFQWKQPGASPNMCDIPFGCQSDSAICAQMSGLLAHGVTDALSKKGLITLPPMGWSEWRGDNAWEVAARFALPQNRKSIVDRIIDISVDPKRAANKYIAAIDDVDVETKEDKKTPLISTDEYVTDLSLIKAVTPPNSCMPKREPEILNKNFYGVYESTRLRTQAKANTEQQRFFHQIALFNALGKLPVRGK